MKIFKYQIPLPGIDLEMPIGSRVLSLQLQGSAPTIWVLINDELSNEYQQTRRFRFVGTGHEINEQLLNGHYIGTIQQDIFVWHLFELPMFYD